MGEAVIVKKKILVQTAAGKFEPAASVVIMDYHGSTAEEVTNLRKQSRDAGIETKVIKDSILSRAVKKVGLDGLDEVLTDPTAVAFSSNDIVVPVKIIGELVKDTRVLEIKGGVTEGKVPSAEQTTTLVKLSNHEGLLSMLLSILQASVRSMAYAVEAVVEKNEEVA